MYQLNQQQTLNAPVDEVWQFIAHPGNLNKITPPELDFEIISDVPDQMYDGLLIQYKVKLPLLETSDWITEIKHIIPAKQFIDEQRSTHDRPGFLSTTIWDYREAGARSFHQKTA